VPRGQKEARLAIVGATIAKATLRRVKKMVSLSTFKMSYVIGAAIVWAGLFIAIALTLSGTPYFSQLLPLLAGGSVWFVIIVPAVLNTVR
jgi:hypothetical protein